MTKALKKVSNERAERFDTLAKAVGSEFYQRDDIIRASIRAMLARKHVFMIGTSGTAKSEVIRRIMLRISDFRDDPQLYFKRLMTPYTTDDEIFGAPDLVLLSKEGRLKRNIRNRLPMAYFAFLDEGPRANSAVLNTLLTAMHEREFDDEEGVMKLNLITVFMAGNSEFEGKVLQALWDRLHVRLEVESIKGEGDFRKMYEAARHLDDVEPIVSLEDFILANQEVKAVEMTPGTVEAVMSLRRALIEEGFEFSDRRWNEARDLIRAEAWMNGRTTTNINDVKVMRDTLWDRVADRKQIWTLVSRVVDPFEGEAFDLHNRLRELIDSAETSIRDAADNKNTRSAAIVEGFNKATRFHRELLALEAKIGESPELSTVQLIDRINSELKEHVAYIRSESIGEA